MNDAPVIALSPETVLEQMKKNGITHVVWLPDSRPTADNPKQHLGRTLNETRQTPFYAHFANKFCRIREPAGIYVG